MLKFYHAPHSRSSGILWVLEELELNYETHLVDVRAPGGAPESYREIHPHKKVPAIVHDGVTITESAAIALYLGDRFPKGELTPKLDDPRRGPYLSWLVYNNSVFDPALTAQIKGWEYTGSEAGFGKLDSVMANIERTLARSAFLTGKAPTLADFFMSGGLFWAIHVLKGVEETPRLREYMAAVQDRPSYGRYTRAEQRMLGDGA